MSDIFDFLKRNGAKVEWVDEADKRREEVVPFFHICPHLCAVVVKHQPDAAFNLHTFPIHRPLSACYRDDATEHILTQLMKNEGRMQTPLGDPDAAYG